MHLSNSTGFPLLSLIVAIVGVLVYALATGQAKEIGRIAFSCGLLAFLLQCSFLLIEIR